MVIVSWFEFVMVVGIWLDDEDVLQVIVLFGFVDLLGMCICCNLLCVSVEIYCECCVSKCYMEWWLCVVVELV